LYPATFPRPDNLIEILCTEGAVSRERAALAVSESESTGRYVGDVLLATGVIAQESLIAALCRHNMIPSKALAEVRIEDELIAEIPAEVACRHRVFPVGKSNGSLELAMENPFDASAIDMVTMITGMPVKRFYSPAKELEEALKSHYAISVEDMFEHLAGDDEPAQVQAGRHDGDMIAMAMEPSLVNMVNLIILRALEERSSDIHIEPFENALKIKYRIDGVLYEQPSPPKNLQAAIISRVKIMAEMDIAERFLPQDGHIKFSAPGRIVDIRVSTVPTIFGESVVMRLLDKSSFLLGFRDLGIQERDLEEFRRLLTHPHGIILVTGPTGSGKTTTLYASLHEIYSPAIKMITIEDPVEYQLDGINQIPVNPKRGLTFALGLRHILRQDPDVVMVGEIRDYETAETAIRSALTGHLVLSTLHTNDAMGAVARLLDMGVEPYLIASSVLGFAAQRLVRRICRECKENYEPDEATRIRAEKEFVSGKVEKWVRGAGCGVCHNTGYQGRTAIFELLTMDEVLRELVLRRAAVGEIKKAVGLKLVTMRADGLRRINQGITTVDEVLRVTEMEENGI